jgi:hypothetical protein
VLKCRACVAGELVRISEETELMHQLKLRLG